MRRITKSFADKVTKPGFYRVDDTLYLRVTETGSKQFVQRLLVEGRRRNLGLGGYPVVEIDEARAVALDNRRKLRQGISPVKEKQAARVPTFKTMAAGYLKTRAGQWSDDRARMFQQILEKHVFPRIGNTRVDRISQRDTLAILKPIWTAKPHQATRVRNFMRSVFDYCVAHEYLTVNPAGDAIKAALPTVKSNGNNYRALPYEEMPQAVVTVSDRVSSINTRLALLFTILTASRAGEARAAVWSEIDLQARTWTIPGEKMKSGKPHRIPLSDAALDILEQAKALRDGSPLVFPSAQKPGQAMTPQAMLKALSKIGLKTVSHGFRASFKTWATEQTDTPREIVEAALSHVIGGTVEQAYFRGDLFEKRRALMQSWADYLKG